MTLTCRSFLAVVVGHASRVGKIYIFQGGLCGKMTTILSRDDWGANFN